MLPVSATIHCYLLIKFPILIFKRSSIRKCSNHLNHRSIRKATEFAVWFAIKCEICPHYLPTFPSISDWSHMPAKIVVSKQVLNLHLLQNSGHLNLLKIRLGFHWNFISMEILLLSAKQAYKIQTANALKAINIFYFPNLKPPNFIFILWKCLKNF